MKNDTQNKVAPRSSRPSRVDEDKFLRAFRAFVAGEPLEAWARLLCEAHGRDDHKIGRFITTPAIGE